jgi:Flp pilus assembly protein CpaB
MSATNPSSLNFVTLPPRSSRPMRRVLDGLRLWARPILFWALTIVLAVVTARFVAAATEPYPSAWGAATAAVVVNRDLPAGAELTPGDIEIRELPSSLLPRRTTARATVVVGRRLVRALSAGAPIDLAETSPDARTALAAQIGTNRRGVSLTNEPTTPPVSPGDLVDVLVARDGDGAIENAVTKAEVIQVDDRSVLLSMTEVQAQELAGALSRGRPQLVLRGG